MDVSAQNRMVTSVFLGISLLLHCGLIAGEQHQGGLIHPEIYLNFAVISTKAA